MGFTGKPMLTRLEEHNFGTTKWTKMNGPFELKYYETYVCKEDAMRREKFFKFGQGKKLRKLIVDNF